MTYCLFILLVFCTSCINTTSQEKQQIQATTDSISNTASEENISLMRIEQHKDLTFYYPNYKKVGLVVDDSPSQLDSTILFMAAASFTGNTLETFSHSNIAGNHVVDGVFYRGYSCKANTGAFVYKGGKWNFYHKDYGAQVKAAANGTDGMAFGQILLIHDGNVVASGIEFKYTIYYRALCEYNGKLCVAESTQETKYPQFLQSLLDTGVTHAIYMDGGTGWNYSWYRDNNYKVHIIHPKSTKYSTNWLVFYK